MIPIATLLAAGIGDMVEVLVILAIIIISTVAKFVGQRQQGQPPAGRPQPPKPAAPNLGDELDDFVRRAKRRATDPIRAEAARLGPKPKPKPKPPAQQPIHAEVVAAVTAGDQVADHDQKHLVKDGFASRRQELGGQVISADRQNDQRLHQVFDHTLGKITAVLDDTAAPSAPAADQNEPDIHDESAVPIPTFATDLASLLTDPGSLQQAVVLSEILQRPEW